MVIAYLNRGTAHRDSCHRAEELLYVNSMVCQKVFSTYMSYLKTNARRTLALCDVACY